MLSIVCTIYYEDPFWVGVFERLEYGSLSAAKFTFGAEPGDPQVLDLILHRYGALVFSPSVAAEERAAARPGPKRMQRLAARAVGAQGIGTRAQQALKAQREEGRQARRRQSRAQREQEQDRQFAIRQQRLKEKRRGH